MPVIAVPDEETANTLICALGLALSIAGLAFLVTPAALHGDAWQVVTFSVYGASLILLYAVATLYHAVRHPPLKRVLEIVDQSAIYLLIAGTYTPFTLVTLRSPFGWTLFGVIWGLALTGIVVTLLFPAEKLQIFSSLSYLVMGWLILTAAVPLVKGLPDGGPFWLAAGGLFYSAGVPVFFMKKRRFAHAVWHLFVLAGSACHYMAVRAAG